MKKITPIAFAIIISGIFSCNIDVQENKKEKLSQENTKEVLREEIETALQNYVDAVKTLNVNSVVDCWTEDSRFISINNDINGKKEFTEMLTQLYENLNIIELKARTTKLDVSDNLAVQMSEYSEILSMGDNPIDTISG